MKNSCEQCLKNDVCSYKDDFKIAEVLVENINKEKFLSKPIQMTFICNSYRINTGSIR